MHFTQQERQEYLDTYLCVRCLQVVERDENGYPVESYGAEASHLLCLPFNSYIDALSDEFADVQRGCWVLPICQDCIKDWEAFHSEQSDKADGHIIAMVQFVAPICEAYPWEACPNRAC